MNPPAYNRPSEPGIAVNFDNSVSLYLVVEPSEGFEQAAGAAFGLLRESQRLYPDWPRQFFVDILGHRGPRNGFDEDFFEFQQEFWFSVVAPFVTAFELPITGALANPEPQRNDIPDSLRLDGPETQPSST